MGGVCLWVSSALCPFAALAQGLVQIQEHTLVQGEVEEGGSVPLLLIPVSVGQWRAGSETGAAAGGGAGTKPWVKKLPVNQGR